MFNKKLLSVLVLSAAAFTFASCSKSSDANSANTNNGAGTNQVVATIGGKAITFKTLAHSGGSYSSAGGFGVLSFAIAGIDSATGNAIAIGGGGFVGTGTYDIGLQHTTPTTSAYGFGMNYQTKDAATGNTTTYSTDAAKTKSVGTITITSISATGAEGTFTAQSLPQTNPSGTTNTIAISNGGFNVTF
jgi:hypothetical protein